MADQYIIYPPPGSGGSSSGPIEFELNGGNQTVTEDTITPANNRPLPVKITGPTGDVQITSGALDVNLASSGTSITANQGSPAAIANGWPMKITDGTDVASVTGGGLLEVSVSASLPAGGNNIGIVNQGTSPWVVDASGSNVNITGNVNVTQGTSPWVVDGSASVQPVSGTISVGNFPASQTVNGTVTANIGTSGSLALEATLSALSAKFNTLGQKTMANSAPVVIASDQSTVNVAFGGKSKVVLIRNDYTSVNVTTAAYVQLVASTSAAINRLSVFDSSGQTLVIAVGAAASEVDQFYVFPGGNGDVDLFIPAASRISIKAVSATASVGELDINCFS